MKTTPATLAPFGLVLEKAHYTVQTIEFDEIGVALAAETPYALVLCFQAEWDGLEQQVEQAQALLTQLAATHPSPRSWDTYVVAVLENSDSRFDSVRERLESDTRYARKILAVATHGKGAEVERAIRLLLPLRLSPDFPQIDPLEAIRAELLELGVDTQVVSAAIEGFAQNSEVYVQ